MIKVLLLGLVGVYLILGVLLWNAALSTFGGKQDYIEYLKESNGYIRGEYYILFVIWAVLWPLIVFIGKNEEEGKK